MRHEKYSICIDECNSCIIACNNCITSCLNEKDIHHLTKCIQLNMECAAICRASVELMTLGSIYAKEICEICAEICDSCSSECEKHSMQHCKKCADVCRKCALACREMSLSIISK